jgi:hypothetical protein
MKNWFRLDGVGWGWCSTARDTANSPRLVSIENEDELSRRQQELAAVRTSIASLFVVYRFLLHAPVAAAAFRRTALILL